MTDCAVDGCPLRATTVLTVGSDAVAPVCSMHEERVMVELSKTEPEGEAGLARWLADRDRRERP